MNQETEKHIGKHYKRVDLLLVMKSWVKNIPENKKNIIISSALNYCVEHENIQIKGYLIEKRRLFLIMIIEKHELAHVLKKIYNQVALGIVQYEKMKFVFRREVDIISDNHHELFEKLPFLDQNIKTLILGKTIDLPYYSPKIARLKDQIHNYNFCSALDYSGAIGPVVVNTDNEHLDLVE